MKTSSLIAGKRQLRVRGVISSQLQKGKVQRLFRKEVQSSDWKQEPPEMDEDIV